MQLNHDFKINDRVKKNNLHGTVTGIIEDVRFDKVLVAFDQFDKKWCNPRRLTKSNLINYVEVTQGYDIGDRVLVVNGHNEGIFGTVSDLTLMRILVKLDDFNGSKWLSPKRLQKL